ncbi:NAD(P)/FAD-dependent oxidoreductase [Candidatus Woesearchaeota archaeon]|nr:NAD(P)/FAD-dependent oxidoreductase [Candidatus Woesearchaeota archaeon]
MARILVLGGGIGGIVAANALRRRVGRMHDVTLIERTGKHLFAPSLFWMLRGWRSLEQIQRPLDPLRRKGIEVLRAEVECIDTNGKIVQTSAGAVPYDYLVISLGAELQPGAIPGLAEHGYNLYDAEDIVRLREALGQFKGKAVVLVSRLPFKCPAAPYEAAFLLRELLPDSEVELCTPEPLPMPVTGPKLGTAVREMLASQGITFSPERKVVRVDKGKVLFEGQETRFDLLAYVPPHSAPAVLKDARLTNDSGWVPVDAKSLRTPAKGVYAVGDCTSITLPDGKPLPKAGVFAHRQAEAVAMTIAAELGRGKAQEFDGAGMCFLETASGVAGLASGNFYGTPRDIRMHGPSRLYGLLKALFERYWFWKWL